MKIYQHYIDAGGEFLTTRSAMGLFAVCDCGISRSISLTNYHTEVVPDSFPFRFITMVSNQSTMFPYSLFLSILQYLGACAYFHKLLHKNL